MVTVKLKFSKTEQVQVFVDKLSTTLSLKPIKEAKYEIGEDLKDKEVETLPIEVLIQFINTKSIDVVIGALNKIKENIEYIEFCKQIPLAC